MPAVKWKCPDPDCPPTDKSPMEVQSFDGSKTTVICRSECSKEYPKGAIRVVMRD